MSKEEGIDASEQSVKVSADQATTGTLPAADAKVARCDCLACSFGNRFVTNASQTFMVRNPEGFGEGSPSFPKASGILKVSGFLDTSWKEMQNRTKFVSTIETYHQTFQYTHMYLVKIVYVVGPGSVTQKHSGQISVCNW